MQLSNATLSARRHDAVRAPSPGPEIPRARPSLATDRGLLAALGGPLPTQHLAASAPRAPGESLRALAQRVMETASTLRKGAAPEGRERVLTPFDVERVTHLVESVSPAVAAVLASDVAALPASIRAVGAALYLKACAARSSALCSGIARPRLEALATLATFARRLASMSQGELLARTTVIDRDSRRSTSSFEALELDARRGRVRGLGDDSGRADNDGLLQRFLGSCGPTTLQMAMCEVDPVRALAIQDQGVGSVDTEDLAGQQQRHLLHRAGSAALGRVASFNRARVHNAMGRLQRATLLHHRDGVALRRYLGGAEVTPGAERALAEVRRFTGGFPSRAEVDALRADDPKTMDGLDIDELLAMAQRELGALSGLRYEAVAVGPRTLPRYLDRLFATLRRGIDVPFGVTASAHWMLFTDARQAADGRWYMVSDSYTGRTCWVHEDELRRGSFSGKRLELVDAHERDAIDFLILPALLPAG